MKKGTKTLIGVLIVIILIVVIVWLVYDNTKSETASVNGENNMPNAGAEVSNSEENVIQNEEVNNELVENEVETNEVVENVTKEEETKEPENDKSEVVSGTNASREEKALQLAKDYYEENYGNAEDVYFNNQGVNGDGNYIVRAGVAGVGSYRYFIVNLDTEEVTEK